MKAYASWYEKAVEYIREEDEKLPPDVTIEQRKKAISAAYPWGERRFHPYKMWLKAQKEYMARFVKSDSAISENHLSPLERMMKKASRP